MDFPGIRVRNKWSFCQLTSAHEDNEGSHAEQSLTYVLCVGE